MAVDECNENYRKFQGIDIYCRRLCQSALPIFHSDDVFTLETTNHNVQGNLKFQ